MFLNLDKKDRSKIAVIDDSKQSVTYGYLCDFATEFKNHLPERTLTFILAENTIGSLLGYFAMIICMRCTSLSSFGFLKK